jgi:hypothetical protein
VTLTETLNEPFILKAGPPLTKDEFPVELVAIIAGVCGGVLLIGIMITVIACVLVRRSPKKAESRQNLPTGGNKVSVRF